MAQPMPRSWLTSDPGSRVQQIAVTVFVALSAAFLAFETSYALANLNTLVHVGPGHSPGILNTYRQEEYQLLWFGLGVNAVFIVGTWTIWRWFIYVLIALGFASIVGVFGNLIGLLDRGGLGLLLPPVFNVLAMVQSAAFLAIAVWLVLSRTRGTQPAVSVPAPAPLSAPSSEVPPSAQTP